MRIRTQAALRRSTRPGYYEILDDENDRQRGFVLGLEENPSIACTGSSGRDSKKMRRYRRAVGLCQLCFEPATMTHHIVPVSQGGKESESNYLAVCFSCHESLHPELNSGIYAQWRRGIPNKWRKDKHNKVG